MGQGSNGRARHVREGEAPAEPERKAKEEHHGGTESTEKKSEEKRERGETGKMNPGGIYIEN
jgi:hypothetical protein